MRTVLFLILFLSAQLVLSQTLVEKTLVDSAIRFIEIDASDCFDIKIETIPGNEMQIEAKIDGEYHKDLLLNIFESGKTLQVSTSFQPNFVNPNDKLSAHKVISIALHIFLPKHKNVNLNGTSCNVFATGIFNNLNVSLNDGQCSLNRISEEVTVRTQSGDISIEESAATILAKSKYGQVDVNTIPEGDNSYVLKSVTGNIRLIKTE